ncbi:MAG: hypothetical protein HRU28_15470 [Rhizobiales bacterium]|nr:hypothetical protein [Hyphomicrobiales bacterium]
MKKSLIVIAALLSLAACDQVDTKQIDAAKINADELTKAAQEKATKITEEATTKAEELAKAAEAKVSMR